MADEVDRKPWESLEQLAQSGDAAQLGQFIDSLPAGEAARAISRLDAEEQNKVLSTLAPEHAADLIEDLPQAQAADLIEQLQPQQAAAIITELPSDQQADLITTLNESDRDAILSEMGPDEAEAVKELAQYPADEAGGLMITEFLQFSESARVADVLDDLRFNAEVYADYDVQYVYCVSSFGQLVGVLHLRDLLLTPSIKPVSDVMIRKPISVRLNASLQTLHDLFESRSFFGVPVVDADGALRGVVRRRDVEEAFASRAQRDYLKSHGIIGGEELRTMPLRQRAVSRLAWLCGNIVLNIAAAMVIAFYQETLEQVIALAVFLPVISNMSGNAGIQAIAVSLRELALGLIKTSEMMWVLWKELSVSVINGLVLGLLAAAAGFAWKGNAWLGLVVGIAMCLNTIIAGVIGGLLPLALKRLRIDPALASGPILTTVTDMCGFVLVLSVASALLRKLT